MKKLIWMVVAAMALTSLPFGATAFAGQGHHKHKHHHHKHHHHHQKKH
jgi:hypothetical protein